MPRKNEIKRYDEILANINFDDNYSNNMYIIFADNCMSDINSDIDYIDFLFGFDYGDWNYSDYPEDFCELTPIYDSDELLDDAIGIENSRLCREIHGHRIRGKLISAGYQHISYDDWESYARDQPYCPLFNEECRESNREKYNRKCFICGLSESKNITSTGKQRRLSVHHVDMNKQQGCDGVRWKLVPACMFCHNKLHDEIWIARITWLLNNIL